MSLQGGQRTMTDMLKNESRNTKGMKIEYALLDNKNQAGHIGLNPKPRVHSAKHTEAQHVDISASLYAV